MSILVSIVRETSPGASPETWRGVMVDVIFHFPHTSLGFAVISKVKEETAHIIISIRALCARRVPKENIFYREKRLLYKINMQYYISDNEKQIFSLKAYLRVRDILSI